MKIAALYNVFDGEELLESSLLSIRSVVNLVVVVWQTVSYSGLPHPRPSVLRDLLYSLRDKGLIDDLCYFSPEDDSAQRNEIMKRNIALHLALNSGCTHVIPMDVDEIYDTKNFALEIQSVQSDRVCLYCRLYTYYKYSNVRLYPIEPYFVPCLVPVSTDSVFRPDAKMYDRRSYVLVDPARRVTGTTQDRTRLAASTWLHHFSYVRRDIRLKLLCSSAYSSIRNKLDDLLLAYDSFTPCSRGNITMPQRLYDFEITVHGMLPEFQYRFPEAMQDTL